MYRLVGLTNPGALLALLVTTFSTGVTMGWRRYGRPGVWLADLADFGLADFYARRESPEQRQAYLMRQLQT